MINQKEQDVYEVIKDHHRYNSLFEGTSVDANLEQLREDLLPENLVSKNVKRKRREHQRHRVAELCASAPQSSPIRSRLVSERRARMTEAVKELQIGKIPKDISVFDAEGDRSGQTRTQPHVLSMG